MADVPTDQRPALRPRRGRLARRRRGAALRRDRRRAARRSCCARSPYNAVAIDLPKPYGADRAAGHRGRPLRDRRADDRRLARGGRPGRRPRAGDLGDDPGLHRPRRRAAAPATASSPGSGSRTSRPARSCPHERTLPGPKQDRLDLTRATRHNLSPIFSLSTEDPWPLVAPAIERRALGRGDRRRRHRDPGLAGRRPGDPRRRHRAARRRRSC